MLEWERIERTEWMEETEERTEKRPQTDTDPDPESTQSRQKKGQMKSIFLSDSDVQRQAEEGGTLGKTSSFQEFICQHSQEVVQDSTYRIWQVHSHEVRTSCSEEHKKTDSFYEVTSEGRECLSLLNSSHH